MALLNLLSLIMMFVGIFIFAIGYIVNNQFSIPLTGISLLFLFGSIIFLCLGQSSRAYNDIQLKQKTPNNFNEFFITPNIKDAQILL